MPEPKTPIIPYTKKEITDGIHFFLLIVSVYVLIVFAAQTMLPLAPSTNRILDDIDYIVCACYFGNFLFQLWTAPSKLQYLKWGWFDFISSIPILPVFHQLGWEPLVRALRILRALRATKIISQQLYRNRARTGLISVVLISFLISVFAAIAELNFETTPDANIKTPEDALWWAFSTITTVSCEEYPVTEGGRVVALFLMAAGVCLFGTIAAYIATVFLAPLQGDEDSDTKKLSEEIRLLREEIKEVKKSNQDILSRMQ